MGQSNPWTTLLATPVFGGHVISAVSLNQKKNYGVILPSRQTARALFNLIALNHVAWNTRTTQWGCSISQRYRGSSHYEQNKYDVIHRPEVRQRRTEPHATGNMHRIFVEVWTLRSSRDMPTSRYIAVSMGCATTHCVISFAQSPSQNSCMHPTPGGDSSTPTTDRRSLLSFVAAFALVFTARCYASAVLARALCPSVCPSVCQSQVGVLLKRLNTGLQKQHLTIDQGI